MTAGGPEGTVLEAYRRLVEREEVQTAREVLRCVEREIQLGPTGPGEPSILGLEITQARRQGEKDRDDGSARPPRLLLLPVGYSPEPLLLSVAYHAPEEVLLLLPPLKQDFLGTLERVWDAHHLELGIPPYGEVAQRLVADRATAVFQAVRQVVEERSDLAKEEIAVDITGGKKSMVAGAFLAAGRLGITTAYVDFEDYDEVLRRPIPGKVLPGRLQDPYTIFRLREEDRLEAALDGGRYEEAERLAAELAAAAMDLEVEEALGSEEALRVEDRYRGLGAAAFAYRLWSDGFYADAKEAFGDCRWLPVPPAVDLLGGRWPGRGDSRQDITKALGEDLVFADSSVPLAYFVDVLAWWDESRLARRPREGYVRLYGTAESLLSFLVHAHAGPGLERLRLEDRGGGGGLMALAQTAPETRAGVPIDWPDVLQRSVVELAYRHLGTAMRLVRGVAVGVGLDPRTVDDLDLPEETDRERIHSALSSLQATLSGVALPRPAVETLRSFSDLRHKAVHWLAPVPETEAAKLRASLCVLLRTAVPTAAERLAADGRGGEVLDAWCRRVLDAADGRLPADCRPLLTRELLERVSTMEDDRPRGRAAGGRSAGADA